MVPSRDDSGTARASWWRQIATHIAILLALTLVGTWVTRDVPERFDLNLADDSSYMARGLLIPEIGLPNLQDGPLYAVWYLALSPFAEDRIDLYYLAFRATLVLLPVAIVVCLLAAGVPGWIAGGLGLGYLVSPLNLLLSPRVSQFALAVLIFGGAVVLTRARRGSRLLVGTLTILLAALVRPEFFVALLLCGGMGAWQAWRALAGCRLPVRAGLRGAVVVATMILGALTALAFLGSGDRQLMAFGQHYAARSLPAKQEFIDPWRDWPEIVEGDFGKIGGPMGALLANPVAFGDHVAANTRQIPGNLLRLSGSLVAWSPTISTGAVVVGSLLAMAWLGFRSGESRTWSWGQSMGPLLVGAVLVGPLVSCLVVYPRDHYLSFFVILGLVIWAVGLFGSEPRSARVKLVGGGWILALVLLGASATDVFERSGRSEQPHREVVLELRNTSLPDSIRILDAEGADGGYCKFLDIDCKRVDPRSKDASLEVFLEREEIDVVVLSDRLDRHPAFRADGAWATFSRVPRRFGFEPRSVSGRVLLRTEGAGRELRKSPTG